MKTRIYFLDNLRTFLIFLVVILHSGLVYEQVLEGSWIVVDPEKIDSLGLMRMYLDIFVMFSIFFISGYFIPMSIKTKTSIEFIKSKFKRIIIPWFVAVITLIPAYKAIFLYSRGLPQEAWYTYFHIFQRSGGNMFWFADNPTQNWLWFLPVLFIFQIIYLVMAKTGLLKIKINLKNAVIITFICGLAYSLIISFTGLTGWFHSALLHFQRERLLLYFMAFLIGSLVYKLKVFESNKKGKKMYIISNIVLTFSLGAFTAVALNIFFNLITPGRNFFFISENIDKALYYGTQIISMLCLLHILIYSFRCYFNRSSKILKELNSNSYYVYIIHMIIIGLVAMVMMKTGLPVFVKYLVVSILSYIISNIIVSGYRGFFRNPLTTKSAIASLTILVLVAFNISSDFNQIRANNSIVNPVLQDIPTMGIHEAVLMGDIVTVKQHIDNNSNINAIESTGGSTPLIIASTFGKTDIAILLINSGANLNIQNNEGSTALHSAAFFCNTPIVEALLEKGADKTIRNNSGATPYESVAVPFEVIAGVYEYLGKSLGPLGLQLDIEKIKENRPIIAEILK